MGEISQSTVNFVGGTAAGVAQVLVGHPFDTIKVRLQTQRAGEYKNAFDCLAKTVRHEKISGLYKGVTSPLLGIGLCNAVLFTANGHFRQLLLVPGEEQLSLGRMIIAGSLAGAVMSLVNCPIELFKVRLQIQDPSRPKLYNNIVDCAIKTVRSEGIFGIYRGFTATILRDIPSFAGYFGVYEGVKLLCMQNTNHSQHSPQGSPPHLLSPTQLILAGGLAGFGAWLPCYPQDVIKSRIQSQSNRRLGIWECIRMINQQSGLRGFFKGFGPTMSRAFPANAATFFAYETVVALLSLAPTKHT